jgi:nucleotide-binding universal stress UspA family protein
MSGQNSGAVLNFTKKSAMKKILVPCDFSATAQLAYSFALELAAKDGAEVFVLKVIDVPFMYESFAVGAPAYLNPKLLKNLAEDARANFEKMYQTRSNPKVKFRTIVGPVTTAIIDFIEKEKMDLVVMGTNGVTGLEEYLVGSNTEKVVRYSPVPVFAIRRAAKLSSIRKIVMPTILRLDQPHFVNKVKELQALFDANLYILVVNTPHDIKSKEAEECEYKEYVETYQLQNCTLSVRRNFSEEAGILNFIQEIHGDLVVMATHSRRGLSHLFGGSITEDVVNHASVPIWTYSLRNTVSARGGHDLIKVSAASNLSQ